ncbi:hypothetical protein CHS0354_041801 [Potamilus streckersoni]|uniref:GH18 domain-containing protein n=1 Tax=Potamilus streckersoni TaxID=2493646 RepID=A0AAE0T260_9BIVA|nr:hypothetical protein CHS0354_041801 [Potamilus streckersoni]
MHLFSWIFCIVSFSVLRVSISYHVMCVYTNWAQYRAEPAKFNPDHIDPLLCTHIMYAYAKLQGHQLSPVEWNDKALYKSVAGLKARNPGLKTILAVGGWGMGSKDFSLMAAYRSTRRAFVDSAIKFLRVHDFDGLAIDWQYPTIRGGRKQDKKTFTLLLKELREEFNRESNETKNARLLLVVGAAVDRSTVEDGYEVDLISKEVDFINVMAYDFHGPWENKTGHPSPLFARNSEREGNRLQNVDESLKYWVMKGAEPTKLLVGISLYSRSFTLANPNNHGYSARTKSAGTSGMYTKTDGLLASYEMCDQYPDAKRVWNGASLVPYWISGNQWIAGEDAESLRNKVNWLRLSKYGGLTVWSLDMDDFNGQLCGKGYYPLLNAIKERLEGPKQVWTTPNPPPRTTEMMSTMLSSMLLIDEMTSTTESLATTKATRAVVKEIKKVLNSSSLFKETITKIGITNTTSTPQLRISAKNTGELTERPGTKATIASIENKDFIKPWLENRNTNITNENSVKNETATESIQRKVTVKRSLQSPLPSVTKAVLRWFDLRDLGFGFVY